MSELLEPLHWVVALFMAVVFLIGMVIIGIPIDKCRVRKLELKTTRIEQLLSEHIEETTSNSETRRQEPPQ